jgi:hypothetical protein
MFKRAIRWQRRMPKYLSSDHDPLYRFVQWQANLRILEIDQIKTVPYVPLSHPFVERLIGTFVEDNKRANQPLHEGMGQENERNGSDGRGECSAYTSQRRGDLRSADSVTEPWSD